MNLFFKSLLNIKKLTLFEILSSVKRIMFSSNSLKIFDQCHFIPDKFSVSIDILCAII